MRLAATTGNIRRRAAGRFVPLHGICRSLILDKTLALVGRRKIEEGRHGDKVGCNSIPRKQERSKCIFNHCKIQVSSTSSPLSTSAPSLFLLPIFAPMPASLNDPVTLAKSALPRTLRALFQPLLSFSEESSGWDARSGAKVRSSSQTTSFPEGRAFGRTSRTPMMSIPSRTSQTSIRTHQLAAHPPRTPHVPLHAPTSHPIACGPISYGV